VQETLKKLKEATGAFAPVACSSFRFQVSALKARNNLAQGDWGL
jgi:hypothetical protein